MSTFSAKTVHNNKKSAVQDHPFSAFGYDSKRFEQLIKAPLFIPKGKPIFNRKVVACIVLVISITYDSYDASLYYP